MTELIPTRPRRTTERPLERRPDGAVVAPAVPSPPVALNPTALALWELCDGQTAVDEMVSAVSELFGISSARARADVESALADMRAAGVIR